MPKTGADRQSEYAERKKLGLRVARPVVNEVALAETLIAAGLLPRSDADNAAKVDHALSAAIDLWTSA